MNCAPPLSFLSLPYRFPAPPLQSSLIHRHHPASHIHPSTAAPAIFLLSLSGCYLLPRSTYMLHCCRWSGVKHPPSCASRASPRDVHVGNGTRQKGSLRREEREKEIGQQRSPQSPSPIPLPLPFPRLPPPAPPPPSPQPPPPPAPRCGAALPHGPDGKAATRVRRRTRTAPSDLVPMKSRTSSTRTMSIRPPATLLHRVTIFGGAATSARASAPPEVVAIGRRSAGPRANSRTAAPADRCFWPPSASGARHRSFPAQALHYRAVGGRKDRGRGELMVRCTARGGGGSTSLTRSIATTSSSAATLCISNVYISR
ncbi:atherin isoform X2 [Triticum aestivum]|uniref:atherin isoform X2 n=2 Tax=Triticum aestivum TaxID=4565 RepID=UPI001D0025F9|nr:atherin-like isoform X2 [Triticum aestivum]XP_044404439.1 atherin-like isoform X2 [Triticum aestivum]XP_044404440.1 atherin-like isoform X2 [Triticum aestivum]